mmetsp:Transcript_4613/g.9225  ORF Transcript_4613/g.9225 Transcript_4613/m.9225 type:complete len:292 (-) Transcript_4613:94-969(-)
MAIIAMDRRRGRSVIRSIYCPNDSFPSKSYRRLSFGIPLVFPNARLQLLLNELGLPPSLSETVWLFRCWRSAAVNYIRRYQPSTAVDPLGMGEAPLFRCTEEELLCDILNVVRLQCTRARGADIDGWISFLHDRVRHWKLSDPRSSLLPLEVDLRSICGTELRDYVRFSSAMLSRRQSSLTGFERISNLFESLEEQSESGLDSTGVIVDPDREPTLTSADLPRLLDAYFRKAHVLVGYDISRSRCLYHVMDAHVNLIKKFDSVITTSGCHKPLERESLGESKKQTNKKQSS